MDRKKVYIRNGKDIFRHDAAFNKEVSTDYIDPGYTLDITEHSKMSDTGLLTLFMIKPNKGSNFPLFAVRWDEKEQAVDIDIISSNPTICKLFKAGKDGYCGHHASRISESPRLYKIEIKIPDKKIFVGNTTFNVSAGHAPNLGKIII